MQTKQLWSWLPDRFQVKQPVLLYTSDEHGTNMDTMFSMSQDMEPTVLLIKTTRSGPISHIIGALYGDYIGYITPITDTAYLYSYRIL